MSLSGAFLFVILQAVEEEALKQFHKSLKEMNNVLATHIAGMAKYEEKLRAFL